LESPHKALESDNKREREREGVGWGKKGGEREIQRERDGDNKEEGGTEVLTREPPQITPTARSMEPPLPHY